MALASADMAPAFEKLYTATLNNGEITYKFKELITISIAIASGTDEPLRNHIRSGIKKRINTRRIRGRDWAY
ncbi:carboxymuconolactone decarboxylase family protein [Xenorhabdus khoisanae]|uniref:carboxymuconolactone decarboxylase family protein n=1 Tax=Xenorhabdus khoisanae TaxID=880157 RepID=UPI003D6F7CDC